MSEIVYGFHAVKTLLERYPQRILVLYLLKSRYDYRLKNLIQQVNNTKITIHFASRKWLDNKVSGAVHQGVIAKIQMSVQYQEKDLSVLLTKQDKPLLLVLDGVTDPHNLGACLRCADAAGVNAVIVPRNHSAPLNATAKKVASGAAETVPLIQVTNLVRTLKVLKEHNIWIIGTVSKADHCLYQSKLTGPLALVMGSENKGIRHLTRVHCHDFVSIPMANSIPFLNISVAAGICLFEAVRQRNF
ncbi:23S rRNA (guanosine(2251)-2'-O)-methyltransferase RlmB [Candidatus Curculioniphilus buchneri]|uniref:23S rRNA (guanosine(2251)-2'-O)-methyltransferase RlmB n=1 Tax=Candidatus Curculioniphilus buchneri TaxID=690594 RepID=UPI00376F39F2